MEALMTDGQFTRGDPFHTDLAARGLSGAEASQAGLSFLPNAAQALPELQQRPATLIPYFHPDGSPMMFNRDGREVQFGRVRYLGDGPPSFSQKKPRRYDQPKGSPIYAYFPNGFPWTNILSSPEHGLIITEGEFKALKACLDGFPTIGLGGVYNFKRDDRFLPELDAINWDGRPAYIVFDSDAAKSSEIQLAERRLASELLRRGAVVHIVRLPVSGDGSKLGIDDYLLKFDAGALTRLLDQTEPVDPGTFLIREGTDVEIANSVLLDLGCQYDSDIIFCEGYIHAFSGTHWTQFDRNAVRKAILKYDTVRFKKGAAGIIKLTDSRVSSILKLMQTEAARADFFQDTPYGINCASGFIRFSSKGVPSLEPHSPSQRQRHCLPGNWASDTPPPQEKLLSKLLDGCFKGDADAANKVQLVSEVCGVAALGYATQLTSPSYENMSSAALKRVQVQQQPWRRATRTAT